MVVHVYVEVVGMRRGSLSGYAIAAADAKTVEVAGGSVEVAPGIDGNKGGGIDGNEGGAFAVVRM